MEKFLVIVVAVLALLCGADAGTWSSRKLLQGVCFYRNTGSTSAFLPGAAQTQSRATTRPVWGLFGDPCRGVTTASTNSGSNNGGAAASFQNGIGFVVTGLNGEQRNIGYQGGTALNLGNARASSGGSTTGGNTISEGATAGPGGLNIIHNDNLSGNSFLGLGRGLCLFNVLGNCQRA